MPAFEKQTVVDFSKGLYTPVNRFTRPSGTFPLVSNLIYTRRGALRTVDGSLIQSSFNGAGATFGASPFVGIVRYAPTGAAAQIIALQLTKQNTSSPLLYLIDVSGKSWTAALAQANCSSKTPSAVQAGDILALALGRASTPQQYKTGSITWPVNAWTGANSLQAWAGNVIYQTGAVVLPNPLNGFIYQAQSGGISGAAPPAFPVGSLATVVDGSVVWQNIGSSTSPAPPGADFIFYHGGSLYVWGTWKNYTDYVNLYGPDGLAASDLNNFASWNPVNAIFVGKGDGDVPAGGAVFTLSEAGIAATPQLVLFKTRTTYVLTGFLPQAQLKQAPSGVGCIAPNSVQFVSELGVIRLSYRGFAVFDGQNDNVETFTDPIRPWLFGGVPGITPIDFANVGKSFACQTTNPRTYLCFCPLPGTGGTLVRGFCYDILAQAWSVIDLPFQIACAAFIPEANVSLSPLGPVSALIGGANDGTIRRIFAGDQTWDGVPIQSSVESPEWGGVTTPVYIRRANVRAQASNQNLNIPSLPSAAFRKFHRDGLVTLNSVPVPPTKQVAASIGLSEKVMSASLLLDFMGQVTVEGIEWHYRREAPQPIEPTSVQASVLGGGNVASYQVTGSASVPASAQSVTVTLPTGAPSTLYALNITANWNTTLWVSQKTTTTFTVYFATPAPGDGSGSIDFDAVIA